MPFKARVIMPHRVESQYLWDETICIEVLHPGFGEIRPSCPCQFTQSCSGV